MMLRNMSQVKVELRKWFHSAKSSQEMLKVFTKMESCFDEDELGLECLALSKAFLTDGFLEKVLLFGKRALQILLKNHNSNLGVNHTCEEHKSSMAIAFALQLLGNACLELDMFDDSLRYLNWADRCLSKIELDVNSSCGGECVLHNLLNVQILLFRVNWKESKINEGVVHLRKIVEIRERVMEEGCIEIGQAYRDLYEAYVTVGDLKEAQPYCLKALQVYSKRLGGESVEVAEIMSALAAISYELGECEKALELITSVQRIMKRIPSPSSLNLLLVENQKGDILIEMGRYEEAVTVLKTVISHTPVEVGERAFSIVSLAKAFCELKKFVDAKKNMKAAQGIFEQKQLGSIFVAKAYGDMSRMYEKMNDLEMAISMLKIALTMPEILPKVLAECVMRFFSLVSLTGKEKELISYLEDLVEKLKEDFGPSHREVGCSYARLGLAYFKLGQEKLAVKLMENAKDIMDASLGPHHLDSLRMSQMLSLSYKTVKRYRSALLLQEEVIQVLKGLGSSQQEFMDEAVRLLNSLKEKVTESRTKASSGSEDGKDLCARISKCGISDDGLERSKF